LAFEQVALDDAVEVRHVRLREAGARDDLAVVLELVLDVA
jgi:hypothetical protein